MLSKPDNIPSQPGVYKWRDVAGRVIYVGKAKNLKNRLSSYFRPSDKLHPRTRQMVQTACSVEWTVVSNEIESLTLEYAWIKEFEPRFNVIFRNDDKSYPYLAISPDKFPRVYITREKKNKRTKYYGPYPQTWAIRATFNVLQELFKVRTCTNGVFSSALRAHKPCLLWYIGRCSAPCLGKVTQLEYTTKNLRALKNFLRGDIKPVRDKLEIEMISASEAEDFEIAAKKRDQMEAVRVVLEKNTAELGVTENADILGVYGDELETGVHVFFVRRGIIVGEKVWILERGVEESDADLITNILAELYLDDTHGSPDIPAEIVVPLIPEDCEALIKLIEGLRQTKVNLHIGQRGSKRDLQIKATENAKNTLENARKRRATDLRSRTAAIAELQNALNLKQAPLRVECYDISHTQGEFQTGAMVVFEEGLPKKKDYRLYNLRGDFIKWDKDGVPDDTAAVYEVISRRLERLNTNESAETKFAYNPQLLLIDGGKPQVNAAYRAIRDKGLESEIQVAGIAKRLEELWLPNTEFPIILPRHSLGLYLVQQLRDEAHRFSIVSMRKRRAKKYQKSDLDNVNGLGEQKQKALLKHFGSVKAIRNASYDELRVVPGIGDELAREIQALICQSPKKDMHSAGDV